MELPLLQLDSTALARSEGSLRKKLGLEQGHQPPSHSIRASRRRGQVEKDIPVVVVGRHKTPLSLGPMSDEAHAPEAFEQALQHERDAREKLAQELRLAQDSIRQLQTKLAHAEIAHNEGLAAARQAREQAEAAAREANEALAGAMAERKSAAKARQSVETDDEEEPVKWWLPNWRPR